MAGLEPASYEAYRIRLHSIAYLQEIRLIGRRQAEKL